MLKRPCLRILANTGYLSCFDDGHLNGRAVGSHRALGLHFLDDLTISDAEHFLTCFLATCVSPVHVLWVRTCSHGDIQLHGRLGDAGESGCVLAVYSA